MSRSALSLHSSGIGWALIATALFTIVAALAKAATADVGVLQVLFIRQLFVFASTLRGVTADFPLALSTARPVLHAVRVAGAFVALGCGIWAVQVLPLAVAITIGFTQVFFVALLAWAFLGERRDTRKVASILAGFVGVVIVMQPGTDGFWDARALIPLVGAIGAAVAIVSVRRLAHTESAATLLFYQSVFIGVLSGAPMLWLWRTPSVETSLLLGAMGLLAALAQWCGVIALKKSEASVVGVFEYTKLVHAELLGFVVFGERSSPATLAGAGVIILASLAMIIPPRADTKNELIRPLER